MYICTNVLLHEKFTGLIYDCTIIIIVNPVFYGVLR